MMHLTSCYEVDIRKEILGLHELPGMTLVEEVIDTISINSYSPRCFSCPSHFQGNLDAIIASLSLPGSFLIMGKWCRLTDGLVERGEVKDVGTDNIRN